MWHALNSIRRILDVRSNFTLHFLVQITIPCHPSPLLILSLSLSPLSLSLSLSLSLFSFYLSRKHRYVSANRRSESTPWGPDRIVYCIVKGCAKSYQACLPCYGFLDGQKWKVSLRHVRTAAGLLCWWPSLACLIGGIEREPLGLSIIHFVTGIQAQPGP